MAKLGVDWQQPKLEGYDSIDPANLLTALPEQYRDGRPVVVFLTSEDPEAAGGMKLASGVLADERVAIGSKMFHVVKMDGDKISRDHVHAATLAGKALPRFVVLDGGTGKKVGSIEYRPTPSSLFALMKKAAAKAYKSDIEKVIKDYQKMLTELDKVEAKRNALRVKKGAASEELVGAKERKLQQEEAAIEKDAEKLAAAETELLKFELKAGKDVAKG